jgi:hypothetical protein
VSEKEWGYDEATRDGDASDDGGNGTRKSLRRKRCPNRRYLVRRRKKGKTVRKGNVVEGEGRKR